MGSLSRRERREAAKKMGLLSKKENYSEMTQRFRRANEAGSKIHTQHIQEIKNSEILLEQKNNEFEIAKNSDEGNFMNPYGFLEKN
jgi:hypothetical protein